MRAKNNMENYHDFSVNLVRKAGMLLLEARRGVIEVSHKGQDERDVVTKADLEVSAFLTEEILKAFPDHKVYSEEDAKAKEAQMSGFEWVLDPIDGTANFSRGIPHFAVCVGLLHDGVVIVGAVYNPVTNELFSFEKERGVFLNGASIKTSSVTDPSQAQGIIVVGHKASLWDWGAAVYREFLEHLKKLKALGSSSLDICFLAAGRADVVLYGTLSTRDIASAIGILRAAGGEIYTLSGEIATLSTKPQPLIATNNRELFEKLQPYLHADLLPPLK